MPYGIKSPVNRHATPGEKPFTTRQLAGELGTMAALTVPFEAAGHMRAAYKTGPYASRMSRLRNVGKSMSTGSGLKSLARRTGKTLGWMAKTSPKWGMLLGLPIAGLTAYSAMRNRGQAATMPALAGEMGSVVEDEGRKFGRTSNMSGIVNKGTTLARAALIEPLGAASYAYQRGLEYMGGPKAVRFGDKPHA